uniref:DNA-directed RNA polymerase subunit N n=1 Tax=viral metagenome TaxID=1070528 RepID=A0A6C0BDN1_9ZZZZ
MLHFILCPSCGTRIGRYYEAYSILLTHLQNEELEKNKNILCADNILISKETNVKMLEIFEALGIKKICCRMHFNTVDFYSAEIIPS